jgi:hypothetical protein
MIRKVFVKRFAGEPVLYAYKDAISWIVEHYDMDGEIVLGRYPTEAIAMRVAGNDLES